MNAEKLIVWRLLINGSCSTYLLLNKQTKEQLLSFHVRNYRYQKHLSNIFSQLKRLSIMMRSYPEARLHASIVQNLSLNNFAGKKNFIGDITNSSKKFFLSATEIVDFRSSIRNSFIFFYPRFYTISRNDFIREISERKTSQPK